MHRRALLLGAIVLFLVVQCSTDAPAAAATATPVNSPEFFTSNGRFCLDGVVEEPLRWQLGEERQDVTVWGSYCPDAPQSGRIESAAFLAPADLSMYVTGLLGLPGMRLLLRNLDSAADVELHPPGLPSGKWESFHFAVPPDWIGKRVQVIGEQDAPVGQWFAFTAPILPEAALAGDIIDTKSEQHGFCQRGTFGGTRWAHRPPSTMAPWGSFCDQGDNSVGWAASQPMRAGATFPLYVAGYPGTPGVRLALENLQTGQQLPLKFVSLPRESWTLYYFPLPRSWRGAQVRVLAEDHAARSGGWVGFAIPPPRSSAAEAGFAFRMVALTCFLFVLLTAPAAAACVIAARKGVGEVVDFGAIVIVTVGMVSCLAFWVYFLSPKVGVVFTYVVVIAGALTIATSLRRTDRKLWAILRPAAVPWLLVGLASLFIVALGFVYGQPDWVQDYTSRRFGPPSLAIDNWLPKILADDVYQGHIPIPFVGDWLSSDRPPLQAGTTLYIYPFTRGTRDLPYEVVGVILQLTFLVGVWIYLQAADVGRRAIVVTVAALLFSGFTIMNAFFTWPKLLPVSFLFIPAAYLFTRQFGRVKQSGWAGALTGAAAALAMLGHGGSAFALIGIAVTLVLMRRIPGARFTVAAVVAAGCVYAPWMLYQKYFDPPGDRLLKWHLAGVIEAHPELKLGPLLKQQYGQMSLQQLEVYKLANFEALFPTKDFWWHHPIALFSGLVTGDRAQAAAAIAAIRFTVFLHWVWALDVLVISVPVLLLCLAFRRRRQSPEFEQAWRLWLCTAVVLIVWCLMMFGPGTTFTFQGSFFPQVAGIVAGALALWALSPTVAIIVVALHVLLNVVVEVLSTPPKPIGVATFMGPLSFPFVAAAALAVLGLVVLLWRVWRGAAEQPNQSEDSNVCLSPEYVKPPGSDRRCY